MSKKSGGDLVGVTVKGYKIIKMIGEGKFSYVYRAQNQNKIPYALKNIKIFDMADQKQRQKCLKQIDLMKALDHPNIIKYIDSFIDSNQLYIVTEWAQKGDLKKIIKQHTSDQIIFQEPIVWEYIKQISSALKHMHEKKIMHRDLKPANIFISHDMSLKIGDLGLGRAFGSQTLQAYSKVGTPLYMSPQLIQDSGYNFNADVWSLGCIAYQLCQLNSPFRNKQQKMSLMDLFQNITKCNYKPISNKYSTQLSQIIKKMIVVDPNHRISSQQVAEISQKNLKGIKKPLLDPYIVMDDIHLKLNLLDYFTYFCKVTERKPINKFYFAIPDSNNNNNNNNNSLEIQNQQLNYFLQLCYWVLGLSKTDKKKQKLALYTKTQIDWSSSANACRKLLVDLSASNIRLQQVNPQQIINGYGQTICYLLNQVLNRQLIRSNFQFKQPKQSPILMDNDANNNNNNNQQQQQLNKQQKQQQQQQNGDISSQQMQQQSIFEQSVFFNNNNNKHNHHKINHNNQKLLQKIQQYGGEQQDKNMILPRVDQLQWKSQCLRVQKKLNDITIYAKQARKKSNLHQHFDTIKINSSKITDLIRGVKPSANRLFDTLEQDLKTIKTGQNKLNTNNKQSSQSYKQINQTHLILSTKSSSLSSSLKQKLQTIQQLQEKLDQFNSKIKMAMQQNQNNRLGDIKRSIKGLQKQIQGMQQKQGILVWQLRSLMIRDKKQGNIIMNNKRRKDNNSNNIDIDGNGDDDQYIID